MHQAPGEAVQKVCPRCSTLAYTGDRRCPWCGGSYRRRVWPGLLALLLVQTVLVLGGVAAMFVIGGQKLDDEVARVQRNLDSSLDRVEQSVRQELDRRASTP